MMVPLTFNFCIMFAQIIELKVQGHASKEGENVLCFRSSFAESAQHTSQSSNKLD